MKNIFAFLVIVLLGVSATRPAVAAPAEDAGQLAIPTPVADDPSMGHVFASGNEIPELPGLPDLPDSLTPDGQQPVNTDRPASSLPEPIARGEAGLLEPAAERVRMSTASSTWNQPCWKAPEPGCDVASGTAKSMW